MVPYLNLDIDFFDHPKTRRLIRLLGRGSEVVPLRLWCYTARYFSADGRLADISAQEIELECRWWGKSGDAVAALLDCEFLEKDGDTFVVHDWTSHEGHIEAFKDRARAAAVARWGRYASRNATSISPSNASSNAPTVPDQTVPTKPTKPKTAAVAAGNGEANGEHAKTRKPPTGPYVDFCKHFAESWEKRYGKKFDPPKEDWTHASSVFKKCDGLEHACKIADLYFSLPDAYVVEQCHPLNLLPGRFNKLNAKTAKQSRKVVEEAYGET